MENESRNICGSELTISINQISLRLTFSAREESITVNTVRNGFAATGLVPYDPERVLSKLNTQLRTPTPPVVISSEQDRWVPETPHNVAQLELQTKTIKGFFQGRTTGSSSPTERALHQLVKGCQMAMHNAVLLAEENKQLRTANQRQQKKRAMRRSYIAKGGVLTVQEGLDQLPLAPVVVTGEVTALLAGPQTRAPRMCSMCKSLEHTARTCPLRLISN
jgi:hypothetical protein